MSASVLYISYDGLTSQIGQSQVVPYLKGLAARGHRLSVLTFEAASDFKELGEAVGEEMAKSGIEWLPRRFRSWPPVLAKAVDMLDVTSVAKRLAHSRRFDLVHCRSYVAASAGLKIKRAFGTKLIFDMRGFWVDQRREGGRWPQNHPFYRRLYTRWKAKEADIVRCSDEIIVLTEAARDEIQSWASWNGCPITVIPCALDFSCFPLSTPAQSSEARRRLAISPESYVLAYLGSLGSVYLLDEMLQFFSALKQRKRACLFLLIGRHDSRDILFAARRLGLDLTADDFRFVKTSHHQVSYWLGAADLAIGLIQPTYSSLGVCPTKLGEYLAAGLPVIFNDGVGDVARIICELDAGHVVKLLDQKSIREAAHRDLKRLEPVAYRRCAQSVFEMELAIDKYDYLYHRLTDGVHHATCDA